MNNDMLLAKSELPAGWVDVGVGDAEVVREELAWAFRGSIGPASLDLSYQPAEGWAPFHQYLVKKHGGKKVIVANGAKHAIMAVLAGAKQVEWGMQRVHKDTLATPNPYWSSFPRMAIANGLYFEQESMYRDTEILIFASPNNPTGHMAEFTNIDNGRLVVHDAAYWSRAYEATCTDANLPGCHVRIYSMSKYLGLSSLRVGYAVFEEGQDALYEAAREYIETSTSGVSVASQKIVLGALRAIEDYPQAAATSMDAARERIRVNRQLFSGGLGRAGTMMNQHGMFAWCQKGPGYDPEGAKVRVIDGGPFGAPDMFRVSLGGSHSSCSFAGKQLGEAAERKLQ